jgi:hypothetical protein
LGKPPGLPGGEWTLPQWRQTLIDFDAIDALAATTACVATAKFRPVQASGLAPAVPATRTGRPSSVQQTDGSYSWPKDSCAYCAFRPQAPPGTAPTDDWWYGTGDGAHNPYRCQPAKRYLTEGGDAGVDAEFAPHLRRCLRVAREPAR